MGIAFEAPLALLLFIPAFLLTVILHVAARRRVGAGRRRVALVLRSLLLAALVLGLAGLQIVLPVNRLATVFVVDLSDSIGSAGREDALAFVRGALEEMPEGDVAGIVAFGKEALVERLPSDLAEIDRIASAPVRSASDIGGALRLATALFPDDAQKRIVLLSDGNDTTGDGPGRGRPVGDPWGPDRDQADRARGERRGARRARVQPVHDPSRRGHRGRRRRSARRSPSRPRSACSSTASRPATRNASTSRRGRTPSASRTPRSRPASIASASSSRPVATPSARTTARIRTRSSRASRGRWCWPVTKWSPTTSSRPSRASATRSTRSCPRRCPSWISCSTTTAWCSSTCRGSA